jgi:hypothetical protein
MSRTYRLKDYKDGKPVYTRNERSEPTYRYYNHEDKVVRKDHIRKHRRACRQAIKKGEEPPGQKPRTQGWETH